MQGVFPTTAVHLEITNLLGLALNFGENPIGIVLPLIIHCLHLFELAP